MANPILSQVLLHTFVPRLAAAGKMLTAILSHAADQSGLRADWRERLNFDSVL